MEITNYEALNLFDTQNFHKKILLLLIRTDKHKKEQN